MPSLVRFLRDQRARWPGTSNPCADPIYVTDVADCALAAAVHPNAVGHAFNAAPQQRTGVRDFLGLMCAALDMPMPVHAWPYWAASAFANASEWIAWLARSSNPPGVTRAGVAMLSEDVRHDPTKAERELGWRSSVSLEAGVAETARWLRERHPEIFT